MRLPLYDLVLDVDVTERFVEIIKTHDACIFACAELSEIETRTQTLALRWSEGEYLSLSNDRR